MAEQHIVAIGGHGLGRPDFRALEDYVLTLSGKDRPRVCFVPTASAEDAEYVISFYEAFTSRAEPSYLSFFPWPPAELRERLLEQDVIYVGGGNTANMLAIWRIHRVDELLREAWERGTILCGSSAGMICWFEAGVTDSFGPQLEIMDCLGFLPGSACPHYDGEELRRPRYHELVEGGAPSGYAAEDAVALHFSGTELAEVVSALPGKRAYRVGLDGGEVAEHALEARLLG